MKGVLINRLSFVFRRRTDRGFFLGSKFKARLKALDFKSNHILKCWCETES